MALASRKNRPKRGALEGELGASRCSRVVNFHPPLPFEALILEGMRRNLWIVIAVVVVIVVILFATGVLGGGGDGRLGY
jgi:hypothetical protein